VLLAEDNLINQQVATEVLMSVGVSVDIANDGREAVEKVRHAPDAYDAVLMDLQMPEMGGYEATSVIRHQLGIVALPIIAMTAHAMVEERQRCLDAGMNDHVTKPVEPERLYAALAAWVTPREGVPVAGPATPAPPASASDATRPLENIQGIDVGAGLRRVAGNSKLYRKLLAASRKDFNEAGVEFRRLLEAGCDADAMRLAHTVKGVSGNLGADRIRGAASALESALKRGVKDGLGPLVEEFDQALSEVVAGLATLDAPASSEESVAAAAVSKGPVDRSRVEPMLRELADLLRKDNFAAEACFDRLAEALGSSHAREMDRVRESIDNLEFAEALAPLANLAAALEIALE
jgi:CheY-like chemotaxis protein/HPt (histidine-containing phosphotransfer) domain-containing protein